MEICIGNMLKHIDPEHKYTTADELVKMGKIQSSWQIDPPDWMVNHYEVINNSACACVSKTA